MITQKPQRIVFRSWHVLSRSGRSNSMRYFVFLSDIHFWNPLYNTWQRHTLIILISSHTLWTHRLFFSEQNHQDELSEFMVFWTLQERIWNKQQRSFLCCSSFFRPSSFNFFIFFHLHFIYILSFFLFILLSAPLSFSAYFSVPRSATLRSQFQRVKCDFTEFVVCLYIGPKPLPQRSLANAIWC